MHETTDNYELTLVGGPTPFKARAAVSVKDWTEGGHRNRVCTIVLTWPGRSVRADSHSVYHAFQEVRALLEPEGLTPDCYGSCADVHASGMQLDMGDGRVAYRLGSAVGGAAPSVNIFETEPGLVLAPVAAQRSHHDQLFTQAVASIERGVWERVVDWFKTTVYGWTTALARRETPVASPSATGAVDGQLQGRFRDPAVARLLALSGQGTPAERTNAAIHALFVAIQEISVLKAVLREKGMWDETLYRRLRTESMVTDHSSAGDWPQTSHSYYPYLLDERAFLRFAFKATKEDLADFDAKVEAVQYLT
jgi:hypothetical protein